MPKKSKSPRATILKLHGHISEMSVGSLAEHGSYGVVLRAAITKSYEFAKFVLTEHKAPFFCSATLRGICEDLIVLSFLRKCDDRNLAVELIAQGQMLEGTISQSQFIERERPWQPVFSLSEEYKVVLAQRTDKFCREQSWKKSGRAQLPSVRSMAMSSGLLEIYEFFYSITSRWVHFSPHILMRMGWGSSELNDRPAPETQYRFSTDNFELYYREFNRVYGLYLFHRLSTTFIDEFEDAIAVAKLLDEIDVHISKVLRWPEPVHTKK